jgi:electron transfer flavoprotein-quinone oxidoreductase
MSASNYDVVIVGAGAAGLTAAIGLARAGFSVAAVEAAPFPGAENWSGCVYFCENLADSAILGSDGVEALAWERRLVERGFFASDGYGLLGMRYRDPEAFKNCYTVLRPIYDHHLAQAAQRLGATIISKTTVESLIRENGRVIGVSTNRGPLYADLVYLAEGDASHLVTREGYERYTDQRAAPKFLQGIKQIIHLPPGAIEERFRVGPEEGVAYEILLRNGTLAGQRVQLNMGGFIYSNRQSLSVGLVLPADNLRDNFGGDPNLLIEWLENLPAFQPWLRGGERGVFGAKIIRGGGAKDIPNLIDEGLAVGGAASAIGVDFPYPNFTGPATGMGLLLTQAACRIRDERSGFTKDSLRRHYLEPLERSHYWQDVEFLRRWPGYVKRTQAFFDRNLDLALGTAYVWTRPNRWFLTKWTNWLRLLIQVAGPGQWQEMREDLRHFIRALRFKEVVSRPSISRLLLDGTINALRDLAGSPRANLPPAGSIRLSFTVGDESEVTALPPAAWRRWFGRLSPVLASAAQRVYSNNQDPLATKLPEASQLLARQINILDFIGFMFFALAAAITGGWMLAWQWLVGKVRGTIVPRAPKGIYPLYFSAARQTGNLSSSAAGASKDWDAKLARLAYHTVKASHIHLLWPRVLQNKNSVVKEGLWHVCPARVYEARTSGRDQLQVVINFENCIKCETCWRTSDLVDWGRDGRHRFVYPAHSPVMSRLLHALHSSGAARCMQPRLTDRWAPILRDVAKRIESGVPAASGNTIDELYDLFELLDNLEGKLQAFEKALAREPRTVDRARSESLETLARYAQQLSLRVVEILRSSAWADSPNSGLVWLHRQTLELALEMLAKAEERARRTWDQRFSWAAADGRQLTQHHLAGLRRHLRLLDGRPAELRRAHDLLCPWLRAEIGASAVKEKLNDWKTRLDAVFPAGTWRELERERRLTTAQDNLLRALVSEIPPVSLPGGGEGEFLSPLRKALLAELGRRDPSIAYRVACHLWARDLATLNNSSLPFREAAHRWSRGEEWACLAILPSDPRDGAESRREACFVPAGQAKSILALTGDRLAVLPLDAPGLHVVPTETLGLRGAGVVCLRLDSASISDAATPIDLDVIQRVWQVLSSADLISIASGMSAELCTRAVSHATTRVQFPGLFHDEESRDAIGKFGAIKKMVAQLAARRYLLETVDYALSPQDFSPEAAEVACLIKAFAAEILGTAPGSASYNAGQVFGGTGYSEDDIFSKFFRDAAAWRFLGVSNSEVFRRHGERLLHTWHVDGRRLATVPNEAQLFEQVAQRKALQAELDEVRVFRSRLRGVVNDWVDEQAGLTNANGSAANSTAAAELAESLARQDAQLLASKALLLRTHARWERDVDAEVESVLARVWLEDASVSLEEFESTLRQLREVRERPQDRPLLDPAAAPPVKSYADFLAATCPYDSGDFLSGAVDLREPRYVPELVEADPVLAERAGQIRELLTDYFGRPRANGQIYERYIESRHRPDDVDLDFCRKHGFFRMMIPKELGGEGRQKVDYYLLITAAQRLADVGISLCIQVNTSIGTTPIFLARDKDLPKARKELEAFAANPAVQKEVEARFDKLLGVAPFGSPRRIENLYGDLNRRLEEAVFARASLRNLAPDVVEPWARVRQDVGALDRRTLSTSLREALKGWKSFCRRASEVHEELGRRLEACSQYLQWIASGQISAFALTEPSAGSDTARVATRAKRRSAPAERQLDGRFRFTPTGQKEPRYLLDARKLVFQADGVFYRWSESAEPARIGFDEYDYETDDPRKCRYFEVAGRRMHFTDVAQLRERNGKQWYDYWEMTGAKMWITNGRMAGVFCLYAKTNEGVTGFVVDRHSEGLIVGKDEAKLGQWGSPTNELSLQVVRVPLENVLGLEGRGQVNALEALNVGRAGLGMSGMAQMAGIIEQCRTFAKDTYGGIPDWVAWRLERMEEDRFTSEALAHEVIGRFEHPQTKSVRMETAIAKMLISETLQRVIETAEEIYGLSGQTQLHLIEKRKRDARVYNIYEGTNEIQRFFILKDMVAEAAPRWKKGYTPTLPEYMSQETLEIEALKADLRHRVASAIQVFGQDVWQNPNFQPSCFPLAEAAAWLKAAECTLARRAWLEQQEPAGDEETTPAWMEVSRRAAGRCVAQVRSRLRRFEEELAHLRRGYYGPEIRAAQLLFDRDVEAEPVPGPCSQIEKPLSVLVVVEPSASSAPKPQLLNGRLAEPNLTLHPADQAALEMALRLRDQASAPVTIQVAAVGPRGFAQVLRESLYLGVDRARLIVTDQEPLPPESAARALAAVIGRSAPFDLILGGDGDAGCQEGLLAQLTAGALGMRWAGRAASIAVRKTSSASDMALFDSSGRRLRIRGLESAVLVEPVLPLRPFTIDGFFAASPKTVEPERWPKQVLPQAAHFHEVRTHHASSANDERSTLLTPSDAAVQARKLFGLETVRPRALEPFGGAIENVAVPSFLESGVMAVVAVDGDGRLHQTALTALRAADLAAASEKLVPSVLVLVPSAESAGRRAVAEVLGAVKAHIILLPSVAGDSSDEVRSSIVKECLSSVAGNPLIVVGETWTESAFAALAFRADRGGVAVLRARQIEIEEDRLVVSTSRLNHKLRVQQNVSTEPAVTWWLHLATDAETSLPGPHISVLEPRVQRWAPHLERFYGSRDIKQLLEELKAESGLVRLNEAEFLIDVGFGVGNRDGYEAVIEPLEKCLREVGVRNVLIGGSRKVTEELHLLPADRQIGQSGTSVNPQVLLAVGVSGAPQHLNYIGARATILAFNRDPEAPIMTLNQRALRPKVFPIVGDLFETVPAFISALKEDGMTAPPRNEPAVGGH